MKFTTGVFFFLVNQILIAQSDLFHFELFTAALDSTKLSVYTPDENLFYEKEFSHPAGFTSDLDEDGLHELLIIDSTRVEGQTNFVLYVYSTLDSIYLADSIVSGSIYPFETFSGEIEGLIIVSGNTNFTYLNNGSGIKSLPINCWKFEDGELFSVNEDLYEIFISENENIMNDYDIFQTEFFDCGKSKEIKSLIASVYINYLNAVEITSAVSFLKAYYHCDDVEQFKQELDTNFYKEE